MSNNGLHELFSKREHEKVSVHCNSNNENTEDIPEGELTRSKVLCHNVQL